MGDLAKQLAAVPTRRWDLRTILAELDDEDRAAFEAALDDDRLTGPAIAAALNKQGYAVADDTVSAWRRRRRG